jgi:hypothetical protein
LYIKCNGWSMRPFEVVYNDDFSEMANFWEGVVPFFYCLVY